MRTKWLRIAAAGLAVLLFAAGSAWAASNGSNPTLSLDAKVINGEVYVKASSLTKSLGGTGTYDAKTSKYVYTPTNQISDVVKKVSPSVVGIIGKVKGYDENRNALAHGTGVVWKANGQIVTNAHVVKDLSNIVVVTADGKQFTGKIAYIDEVSDLAVVTINASGLKPAIFAAQPLSVQVGDPVVAIGTPASFSLRNSATSGIISGMNRGVGSYYKLLQTDAAINPGNSGGPLVNMKGEVIGINSMKFVSDDIDSLGFSIPMDTVQYVLGHFTKYGKVNRASLGFELEESWSAVIGLPTTEPLTVTQVVSDAAKKAGIAAGDELYSIGGEQVSSIVDVNERLKSYLPDQTIEMTLLSDGDLITKKIKLSQWKG